MPTKSKRRIPQYQGPTTWKKRKTAVTTVSKIVNDHKLLNTKQNVTFRFCYRTSIDGAAAGLAATKIFRANGLYDPYQTGVGHQPRGFDQLMALYANYVVKKATIQVWVRNSSGSSDMLGIKVQADTTGSTDYKDYGESAIGIVRMNHPTEKCYATLTVDIPTYTGKSLKDSDLQGTSLANPNSQVYFGVGMMPFDSTNTVNGDLFVVITYSADLINGRQPVSS